MITRFTIFLLILPLVSAAQDVAVLLQKPKVQELDTIFVIGYRGGRGCPGPQTALVTGVANKELENTMESFITRKSRCLSIIIKPEKVKKPSLSKMLQKDLVKVYPNPTIAGNTIQAAMQLQKPDQYQLDLIDASGRVVWMQRLNITTTKYNLNIPTQNTWSSGVYWLRLTSKETGKIYSGKILLQ